MGRRWLTSSVARLWRTRWAQYRGEPRSTSLQSRLHDSRYRRTGPERPYRRHGAQENLLTIDPGSGMQNIMASASPASCMSGTTRSRLALVRRTRTSQRASGYPGAQVIAVLCCVSRCSQQEQDRAVTHARRCRQVDRVDRPSDVFPWEPWRQMCQPPARCSWNEPGKILIIEIGPLQKSKECPSM